MSIEFRSDLAFCFSLALAFTLILLMVIVKFGAILQGMEFL